MQKLTAKEEELMQFFWDNGGMFVKDILEYYEEPKPHINTLSTIVRGLEEKGFLSHKSYGNSYQYYAIVDREEYSNATLRSIISKYFNNSLKYAVSALVESENISQKELKELINYVREQSSKRRRRR